MEVRPLQEELGVMLEGLKLLLQESYSLFRHETTDCEPPACQVAPTTPSRQEALPQSCITILLSKG